MNYEKEAFSVLLICSMFRALIRRKKKLLKRTTNSLGFMIVILLHNDHRHVTLTHAAIIKQNHTPDNTFKL
jgi:hypothetical protein